jgi:hypothetical protein
VSELWVQAYDYVFACTMLWALRYDYDWGVGSDRELGLCL